MSGKFQRFARISMAISRHIDWQNIAEYFTATQSKNRSSRYTSTPRVNVNRNSYNIAHILCLYHATKGGGMCTRDEFKVQERNVAWSQREICLVHNIHNICRRISLKKNIYKSIIMIIFLFKTKIFEIDLIYSNLTVWKLQELNRYKFQVKLFR